MTGVAGVLALVLAETFAGAATFTWLSPLWNETKRSYFTLWSVLTTLLFAWPAWFAASSGAVAGDTGRRVTSLALAVAVLGTATAGAFLLRQPLFGRVVGIVSVPVSLAGLAVMAATGRQGSLVSLFQLSAGGLFLGAAYDGLFLGHWYLTDRKLTRRPIGRATLVLIVTTGVEIAAIATNTRVATNSARPLASPTTTASLSPVVPSGAGITTSATSPIAPSTNGISRHTVARPEEIAHQATVCATIPTTMTAARTATRGGTSSGRRSPR